MNAANELGAPHVRGAVLLPLLGVLIIAIVVAALVRSFDPAHGESETRTVLPFGS